MIDSVPNNGVLVSPLHLLIATSKLEWMLLKHDHKPIWGGKRCRSAFDNGVSTFEELSPRAKQAFLRYPLKFSNSHHAYLPV